MSRFEPSLCRHGAVLCGSAQHSGSSAHGLAACNSWDLRFRLAGFMFISHTPVPNRNHSRNISNTKKLNPTPRHASSCWFEAYGDVGQEG